MSARYLEQGQTVGCSLPLLEVFTIANGFLLDVEVLEYTITDPTGAQVNAAQPARDTIDPTVACADGGNRKAVGHYVVTGWTAPATHGTYTINWFWKLTAASAEISLSRTFEVVAPGTVAEPLAPYYLTIADLRAEGVTTTAASDARCLDAIAMASRQVEMWTKRFFEPRAHTYLLRGSGNRTCFLDQPIIAISGAAIEATPRLTSDDDFGLVVDPTYYRVFNRHISQGLLSPDDRANPKLEMLHGRDLYGRSVFDDIAGVSLGALIWPAGPQTVRVSGLFGFTDPDGSLYGRTPRMLQYATALLALRYMPKLTNIGARGDVMARWRLTGEKTREQSYTLSEAKGGRGGSSHHATIGYITGDPEIDNILVLYMRPPALGAA